MQSVRAFCVMFIFFQLQLFFFLVCWNWIFNVITHHAMNTYATFYGTCTILIIIIQNKQMNGTRSRVTLCLPCLIFSFFLSRSNTVCRWWYSKRWVCLFFFPFICHLNVLVRMCMNCTAQYISYTGKRYSSIRFETKLRAQIYTFGTLNEKKNTLLRVTTATKSTVNLHPMHLVA